MWVNTKRSKLTQKKVVENKILSKPPIQSVDFVLPGGIGGFGDMGPDISEVTYLTVLRVLSEAVGKLPVHIRDKNHNIVQNATEKLLTVRPNNTMSPVQLFTYMEYCRNHYGNGYCFCDWSDSTGELKRIVALDPRSVRVWVDDVNDKFLTQYYYTYTTPTGNTYIFASEDVIHVRSWHVDDQTRLIGVPVRQTLYEYMTAAKRGQETQNNLYKSGMITSGILNYIGNLSDEAQERLMARLQRLGTKSKILAFPEGWELKPLNLNLSDQQYLETRKFTATQIAAAFGVSPTQLNDYSKGSYANATAQQLSFLQDTLLYISRQYEDELSFKLLSDADIRRGYRVDIDTEAVLQSTPDVLADILTKYVSGSVMTINEARNKAGYPPIDGGDKLMTMPGASTLEKEIIAV